MSKRILWKCFTLIVYTFIACFSFAFVVNQNVKAACTGSPYPGPGNSMCCIEDYDGSESCWNSGGGGGSDPEPDPVSYNVTVQQTTGGIISSNISSRREGRSITVSSTFSNTPSSGYTFSRYQYSQNSGSTWNDTGTSFTMPSRNILVRGIFNPITYTISFNSNGGSTVSNKSVTYNSTYSTLTSPTKTGYTFGGWYLNAGLTTPITTASTVTTASNHTLYAKWTTNAYTVLFNPNGGSAVSNKSVTYNSTYGTLTSPTRAGYTFGGWYLDAGLTTAITTASTVTTASNHTLYAKWTANAYTVSFNSNGGSAVSNKSVTYNSTYSTLTSPTRAGYTFGGWYLDAGLTTAITTASTVTTASNHTLYAKWAVNDYTLSFNSNGGSAVSSKSVTFDSTYGTLSNPTKTGYVFAGWYLDSTLTVPINASSKVSTPSNHSLYAKWQANSYTLSFNSNGGNAVTSKSVTFHESYGILSNSEITGYTFAGWYLDTELTNEITATSIVTTASNHTLYAKWIANNYSLSFNSNGGSEVENKTVTFDLTYNTLSTPEKIGYIFNGWFLDAELTNAITDSSIVKTATDHTLYADWIAIDYNITMDVSTEFGLVKSDISIGHIGDVITLSNVPNEGYALVDGSYKWKRVSDTEWTDIIGDSFTMPADDVQITGSFYAIDYNITMYELTENGIVTPSITVGHIGNTITLTNIPNEGYAFVDGSYKWKRVSDIGWTDIIGDNFTMPAEDVLITGTFYAIDYSITMYELTENGIVTPSITVGHIGNTVTISNTPDEGYAFVENSYKWKRASDIEWTAIIGDSFSMVAEDVLITGDFYAINYDILIDDTVENGTINISINPGNIRDVITLSPDASEGYAFKLGSMKWKKVSDTQWSYLSDANKSFVMPASDIIVSADFIEEFILDIPDINFRKSIVENILTHRSQTKQMRSFMTMTTSEQKTQEQTDPYGNDASEYFIYSAELKAIEETQELIASKYDIASLTGIDYFTNLKNLDVSSNKITEFQTSNKTIELLDLSNNKLTSINTSSYTALTSLKLNSNEIKEIDVSANPNLELLQLNNNKLVKLDVSANSKMSVLEAQNNNMHEINLGQNNGLLIADVYKQSIDVTISNKSAFVIDLSKYPNLNPDLVFDIEAENAVIDGAKITWESFNQIPESITYKYQTQFADIWMDVTINITRKYIPPKHIEDEIFHWDSKSLGADGVRVSLIDSEGNTVYVEDYSNIQHENYFSFGNNILYYQSNDLPQRHANYKNYVVPNTMPIVFDVDPDENIRNMIKRWFSTDDSIRVISKRANIEYKKLLREYSILLEPIIYATFDEIPTAMTPTEFALYDKDGRYSRYEILYNGFAGTYFLDKEMFSIKANVIPTTMLTANQILTYSYGITAISFPQKEVITKLTFDGQYEYRPDIDVYTSFTINSNIDRITETNPLTVQFVGSNINCEQQWEVAAGQEQLVWCKWHTPKKVGNEEISIYIDGQFVTTLIVRINKLDKTLPPDTKADDKKPYTNWYPPFTYDEQPQDTMSWSKWYSQWVDEWYYQEVWQLDETGKMVEQGYWIGKQSFYPKGTDESLPLNALGDTSNPFKQYYSVSLNTTAEVSPDPIADKDHDSMASGYGVILTATNKITGNGERTGIQTGIALFPEFDYNYPIRLLDGTTKMQFKPNKYDINNERTHFSPIWYPNEEYAVRVRVLDVWTPKGMLNTTVYDGVWINGTVFDDFYISK